MSREMLLLRFFLIVRNSDGVVKSRDLETCLERFQWLKRSQQAVERIFARPSILEAPGDARNHAFLARIFCVGFVDSALVVYKDA